MGFSYFHWFWCSLDKFHSKGYVFLNLNQSPLKWIFSQRGITWSSESHPGIFDTDFLLGSVGAGSLLNLENLSTRRCSSTSEPIIRNARKGHLPVSIFIHFVRKYSSVLLFRIFLFALTTHRKSRSQPWGFFFLKYSTLFNQGLEAVSASALLILFV